MAHLFRLIALLMLVVAGGARADDTCLQYRAFVAVSDNPGGWDKTKTGAAGKWCAWAKSSGHLADWKTCVPTETGYMTNTLANPGVSNVAVDLAFDTRSVSGAECNPEEPPPTPDEACSQESFKWNAWSTTQDRTGIVEDARSLPMDQPSIVCMPTDGAAGSPPGCKHKFTPQLRYRMSDTDPWRYEGDSWAMGPNDKAEAGGTLACVPGLDGQPGNPDIPTREDPKPGCEGGIPGQVNGVDVCIDPASGRTEGVDWTRVTDADGNVKEQKTTVKCDGEKCTVTTNTKTPGDPGEGTTTTTTTTRGAYCAKNPASSICAGAVDPTGSSRNQNGRGGPGDPAGTGNGGGNGEGNGFCKENPDLPICKQGSFSGSCAASFACDGDAIQCAIAKEQHIRNCKLFDDPSDESRLYDAEKVKDPNRDVTADLPGNETIDVSGKISYENVLGGGSCIADLNVMVMRQSITLPISRICPELGYLGYVLVAVASLVAARIISGTPKD